jgi:hypothetical protein
MTTQVLTAYRDAAVRMREAAEWNLFDATFQEGAKSRRPGRLVPLVDANIVKFFMDPDHETHLIDSFSNLPAPRLAKSGVGGQGGGEPAPHLVTFARVTAEFMFLSTPVTIGGEKRQLWRETPLITPAHSEETTALLRRIESKVAQLYQKVAPLTEAQILEVAGDKALRSLQALSTAGARSEIDSSTLRSLVHDLSESFEQLYAPARTAESAQSTELVEQINALDEGLRWIRLIREDKLRPMLSHPLCTTDVLQPPEEQIRAIAEPLEKRKRSTESGRADSSARVARRAWRDAMAVVQTVMLKAWHSNGATRKEMR